MDQGEMLEQLGRNFEWYICGEAETDDAGQTAVLVGKLGIPPRTYGADRYSIDALDWYAKAFPAISSSN